MKNNFTLCASPILSYAEAVAYEASIKPIRGRLGNQKPIAPDRSHNYLQIKRVNDAIVVHCPNRAVVIYSPDGCIDVSRPMCPRCAILAQQLLGTQICIQFSRYWIHADWKGGSGWLPMQANNCYTMHDGRLFAPSPAFPTIWRVDWAKMRPIKTKYQDFVDYFLGYVKLRESNPPAYAEYSSAVKTLDLVENTCLTASQGWGWHTNRLRHEHKLDELMVSTEPQNMQRAALCIACGMPEFNANTAKKHIAHLLIRMHRDDVLSLQTIKTGKIVKDIYRGIAA